MMSIPAKIRLCTLCRLRAPYPVAYARTSSRIICPHFQLLLAPARRIVLILRAEPFLAGTHQIRIQIRHRFDQHISGVFRMIDRKLVAFGRCGYECLHNILLFGDHFLVGFKHRRIVIELLAVIGQIKHVDLLAAKLGLYSCPCIVYPCKIDVFLHRREEIRLADTDDFHFLHIRLLLLHQRFNDRRFSRRTPSSICFAFDIFRRFDIFTRGEAKPDVLC